MPNRVQPRPKRRSSKNAEPETSKAKGALAKLANWKSAISRVSVSDEGMYGVALRAAVVKSWEFASFVHRRPAPLNGFFLTATLRGICEDLIALSFLNMLSPDDRDSAVSLLMSRGAVEGMTAQAAFFDAVRPWQPVVRPGTSSVESTDGKLRALALGLGWKNRQAWPSVWFMAKATSLAPLYNYLYSATSQWVHFSPHILLRMGWGGSEGNLDANTRWHFTTKNFSRYYTEFNQVYSTYLFVQLLRGPATRLVTPRTETIVTELEADLSEVLRWPEVVTYEELNLKGPPQLLRLLLWAGHSANSSGPEGAE